MNAWQRRELFAELNRLATLLCAIIAGGFSLIALMGTQEAGLVSAIMPLTGTWYYFNDGWEHKAAIADDARRRWSWHVRSDS